MGRFAPSPTPSAATCADPLVLIDARRTPDHDHTEQPRYATQLGLALRLVNVRSRTAGAGDDDDDDGNNHDGGLGR
jgi:hypothetical protein